MLAPGFIDVHNHSDEGLATDPLAETQVSQGITTLVIGPDGDSPWPIAEYLDERDKSPPAVNVMTMVGHATVRELVMGKDFRRDGDARGDREDGGARRAGHAGRRGGPFLRPRVRRRQLLPRPRS